MKNKNVPGGGGGGGGCTSLKLADRGFPVCDPSLWNALSKHIRLATCCTKFMKVLKTHRFKIAYSVLFYIGTS